ncbi:MAG TPA: ATP-dependent DNA ligase [Actinomycetota bacterium]|nr:ATP-dependent DNA ligase [Actinomycetota bacterium]
MTLPFGPPLAPMLAKLQEQIPEGPGWLYEPKWDGFRAIVYKDGDELSIISRDNKPLERYFPELPAAIAAVTPPACVIDGEVVLCDEKGLDFDQLQLRIHPAASRVAMLSEQIPASFVAFDLLAEGSTDLRATPLKERRRALEKALAGAEPMPANPSIEDVISTLTPAPRVALTPQTGDVAIAASWFELLENVGLDGVIAKKDDLLYEPNKRVMVKIKHKRTADCVVGAYRVHKSGDGVGSLLLGLYDDSGTLHYVGHTSSFKAKERPELLAMLKPLEGGTSFGGGRAPGGPSRWTGAKEKTWVPLKPELVCEVSFDFLQGNRFRHAATFIRWRDDKKPEECGFDQLPLRR